MIVAGLFDEVLIKPADDGADELCIVSGYATSAMTVHHFECLLKRFKKAGRILSLNLAVGMSGKDGISLVNHKAFQQLSTVDYQNRFFCRYIDVAPHVHSKLYIWLKEKKPVAAFTGSANYSQTAFGKQSEILVKCNRASGLKYFNDVFARGVDCNDKKADRLVDLYRTRRPATKKPGIPAQKERRLQTLSGVDNILALPRVTLSFLEKGGTLPKVSGLNWGQRLDRRGNKREPNQVYIPVRTAIDPTFFPPIGKLFTVLTDDGRVFECKRQQAKYGKAITTPLSNSEIGIYFRNRLNVPLGAAVRKVDLSKYGRFDVDFYKIDEETYFMDFRKP